MQSKSNINYGIRSVEKTTSCTRFDLRSERVLITLRPNISFTKIKDLLQCNPSSVVSSTYSKIQCVHKLPSSTQSIPIFVTFCIIYSYIDSVSDSRNPKESIYRIMPVLYFHSYEFVLMFVKTDSSSGFVPHSPSVYGSV